MCFSFFTGHLKEPGFALNGLGVGILGAQLVGSLKMVRKQGGEGLLRTGQKTIRNVNERMRRNDWGSATVGIHDKEITITLVTVGIRMIWKLGSFNDDLVVSDGGDSAEEQTIAVGRKKRVLRHRKNKGNLFALEQRRIVRGITNVIV